MTIYETDRFNVSVGAYGEVTEQQYLVTNKETGVVEFCNPVLLFVRDWVNQMTEALYEQENPKPDAEEPVVMEAQSGRRN